MGSFSLPSHCGIAVCKKSRVINNHSGTLWLEYQKKILPRNCTKNLHRKHLERSTSNLFARHVNNKWKRIAYGTYSY